MIRALPAVLVCAALGLAACSSDSRGSAAPATSSPARATAKATAPARAASLLSGRPGAADGPVFAVKIDNTRPAQPQIGVDQADVVYVEEVEAGLTRLAAVYSSRYPRSVGPVRSGRISDIELLRQYGSVGLVYSGSQRKMVRPLKRSTLRLMSFDADRTGFSRASGRPAPYNVIGDFAALRKRAGKVSTPTRTGYAFGPAPAGGRAASSVTVRWQAARLQATWSAKQKRWLVAMDGRPSTSAGGGRLGPTTFIVQRVKVVPSPYRDVNGNRTPDSRTVGSGTALIFQRGRVHEARWTRKKASDVTTWTIGGKRAVLAPGQLWIALARTSLPVTVR